MRILVIEDDPNLNNQIKQSLEDSGYSVDIALDGEEGHFLGDTEPYDAVVLDLGLPKVDGITVLEKWRKEKKNFPVLILTAREQWSDKVSGFDAGADDYVTKPFQMEEVLARLRALIRRSAGHASAHIPQRIQAMAILLVGSSFSVGASRQFVVFTTGSSVVGSAKPIIGPPITTRSRFCAR